MAIVVKARSVAGPGEPFKATTILRRDPGPRDVLIDIAYSGICHSDIHHVRNEFGATKYPLVPGHEIAGTVSAIGSEVTKFAVGDRAAFSQVRVGDPFHAQTQMGPLASERQRARVEGYIAKGVEQGATLVTGVQRPKHLDRGFYVEPTVFAGVDNGHTIAQEEIFGPVLSVIPAADEADAVRIANDTMYGLNASVFTSDADRARVVAGQLRSGTVGHNAVRMDFGIAFGGFKQSGVGRDGGTEGLRLYLETKTVILNDTPTEYRQSGIAR